MPKLILFTDNQIILTADNNFIDLNFLDILVKDNKFLQNFSSYILNLHEHNKLVNLRLVDQDLNISTDYLTTFISQDLVARYLPDLESNPSQNQLLKIATLRSILLSSGASADSNKIKLITRARQLAHWDNDHKYCGRCGSVTSSLIKEHAKECKNCGLLSYPRITPCILAAVIKDNEILLGRSLHFPAGVYSLLAGFVEVGETAEETVAREVYEESRIRVKNISYYGSQPWPFPHSLMIAYKAEYESGDIIVDHHELEDVRWFNIRSLRMCPELLPAKGSLSRMVLDNILTTHP